MEPIALLTVTAAGTSVLYAAIRLIGAGNRRKTKAWEVAAEQLGLRAEPATFFQTPSLHGPVDKLQMSIATADKQMVYSVEGLPRHISLSAAHGLLSTPMGALLASRRDHETGDAAFDAAVNVKGAERDAITLLFDPELRKCVLDAIRKQQAVLEDGRLAIYSADLAPAPADLVRIARVAIRLAKAIEARLAIPLSQRLEDAIRSNDDGIAQRALELLLERDPVVPGAVSACEQVVAGARGAAVRAKAFEYLVSRLPPEGSARLLEQGLQDAMRPVRLAAIHSVRSSRRMEFTERLATLASRSGVDDDEQLAIAETMSELGGEHAERALLSLLAGKAAAVRVAAAKGLAVHGSIAAVAPLLAAAEAGGVLGSLRTTAQEAVRAIQSRIPDGAAGQLTLAPETPDAAGAVSLADARGALSPVIKPRE